MTTRQKNCQVEFRKTTFSSPRIWCIHYTHVSGSSLETDCKTFIKARSADSAKSTLLRKIKEEDEGASLSCVHANMVWKKFRRGISGRNLNTGELEAINEIAYPNEYDRLFAMEVPRKEGQSNRMNIDYDNLIGNKNGFGGKYGEDSWSYKNLKGKSLDSSERPDYRYIGRWQRISEEDKAKEKIELFTILQDASGNRSLAARMLGVSRNKFYSLLRRFPEVNWQNEFPPKLENINGKVTRKKNDSKKKEAPSPRKI